MFLTVSPIGKSPITLNFNKVESFGASKENKFTEIVMDNLLPSGEKNRFYVTESVDEINRLLELAGEYESVDVDDVIDGLEELSDELDLDFFDDDAIGCVAFGDLTLEVHYSEDDNTIRPYIYSSTEQRYIADAIEATPDNLSEMLREFAKIMSGHILSMEFDGKRKGASGPSANKKSTSKRNKSSRAKIRLVPRHDESKDT